MKDKSIGIAYLDNKLDICRGILEKHDNLYTVTLFNSERKIAGEAVFYNKDDRTILNYLYCMQKYRKTGVGQALIDIVETCTSNKSKAITGIYVPFQEAYDLEVFGRDTKLKINTRKFYTKNHYAIVKFNNDIITNYQNIRYSDFIYDDVNMDEIIFKPTKGIQKRFEYLGDILFDKNIYEMKSKTYLKH